jgi:uncharacterized protein YegJ (DUF2314 family)
MKRYVIGAWLVIFMFGAAACTKGEPFRETRGDDTVIGVSAEDAEMNAIIDRARRTVDTFLSVMEHPQSTQSGFMVKFPFPTDPGSETDVEHIWLNDFRKSGDGWSAVVNNEPFYIKTMKLGDRIRVDMTQVSDWAYVEDGYLVGGESIVYFYNRMSDEEKMDFDQHAGFKIRQ